MRKQPNIIYLFADQWRRHAVGHRGEDLVYTPHIDIFAKESMEFTQAVSTSPLCSPHRASLLTGKYPMSTGVFTNCKVGANVQLQSDERCISDVLKSNGYETGYIGKWHLDLPEKNMTNNPASGADGWDAYTPPGPKRHGFDYWYCYEAWNEHLSPHYWQDSPEKIQVDQWSVEHETDKTITFIKDQEDHQPFALFVSWNPPHSPFDDVPDKYKDLYKDTEMTFRENVTSDSFMVHTGETIDGGKETLLENQKNYFAAISGIDENFGRILHTLKEQGLDDNTIVVLTADHGELMGSHGLMAKHVWYEESIGVPFYIRWPQQITPKKSRSVIGSVDIMPTLLDLLNIAIPETVEGTSLLSTIMEDTEVSHKAFLCAYPGRKEILELFREEKLNNLAYGWRAIRTTNYLYVIHRGYTPGEQTIRLLYDFDEDP